MVREIAGLGFESWPVTIGWLTLAIALVGLRMARDGKVLVSRGGSIVAFELAKDTTEAKALIAAWGPEGKRAAMRSLVADYLWIVLYTSAVALGCLYIAGISDGLGWEAPEMLGRLLAGAALIAGAADAVENLMLILELSRGPTEIKVQVARKSATIKFVLVGTCLFYVAVVRSSTWLLGA